MCNDCVILGSSHSGDGFTTVIQRGGFYEDSHCFRHWYPVFDGGVCDAVVVVFTLQTSVGEAAEDDNATLPHAAKWLTRLTVLT